MAQRPLGLEYSIHPQFCCLELDKRGLEERGDIAGDLQGDHLVPGDGHPDADHPDVRVHADVVDVLGDCCHVDVDEHVVTSVPQTKSGFGILLSISCESTRVHEGLSMISCYRD